MVLSQLLGMTLLHTQGPNQLVLSSGILGSHLGQHLFTVLVGLQQGKDKEVIRKDLMRDNFMSSEVRNYQHSRADR